MKAVAVLAGVVAAAAVGAFALGPKAAGVRAGPAARCHAADGMAYIPAGTVSLGEDGDGRPGRRVRVEPFWIDRHEVTNRQFAGFVAATRYVTQAEREGRGAVFSPPAAVEGLDDASQWWRMVRGASWRRPSRPGSSIAGHLDDPVVQVSYEDAQAYARWAGRALPDETQWERAARGRQGGPRSPIGWAYSPGGKPTANTWQGLFPVKNTDDDGFHGLAPVGCFAPDDFGLYDMIGNAWEWTRSSEAGGAMRVLKGGSYLCSLHYCANFRPAGRQAQEHDLPTSHAGFRTIATRPPASAG